MLSVDAWIEIRELARRRVSVSEIARRTGHDRKTIRKVVAEPAPKTERVSAGPRASKLDPFRDYLLGRIEQGCLNGTVLLEEITQLGYRGRISILRALLTPLRRELARTREATARFETGPGRQAQVDWAKFGRIWVPAEGCWRTLYAFVLTLGYSRAQYLEFVVSCDMEHFLACHLNAFSALGIAEAILYDNLKTGILGRRPDGTPIFPGRFLDFALSHGFTPKFCQPYRARTKGKVKRGIGYVRQNFWVRVAAAVAAKELDLGGLNARAREWVRTVAHPRVHGTHGEVVATRLAEEAPLLGTLAGRARYDTAYHTLRRVGRDGRMSYRGQVYQVALSQALTTVEVIEDLAGPLTVRATDGQVLRAAVVVAGGPLVPEPPPRAGGAAESGLLRLVYPTAPVVESRDLAIDEEVANAAGVG
jgi:transposase